MTTFCFGRILRVCLNGAVELVHTDEFKTLATSGSQHHVSIRSRCVDHVLQSITFTRLSICTRTADFKLGFVAYCIPFNDRLAVHATHATTLSRSSATNSESSPERSAAKSFSVIPIRRCIRCSRCMAAANIGALSKRRSGEFCRRTATNVATNRTSHLESRTGFFAYQIYPRLHFLL
jgi:ferredoxin